MEPINHNANHKACWSSRTKADHREGGRCRGGGRRGRARGRQREGIGRLVTMFGHG